VPVEVAVVQAAQMAATLLVQLQLSQTLLAATVARVFKVQLQALQLITAQVVAVPLKAITHTPHHAELAALAVDKVGIVITTVQITLNKVLPRQLFMAVVAVQVGVLVQVMALVLTDMAMMVL